MGNGGFSLRKRETMIKICERYPIDKIPNHMKPINFMTESDENICPEDVYFSQYLLRLSDAKLPDFENCVKFSIESFNTENPFGGHNFFKNNWSKYFKEYEGKNIEKNDFLIEDNMLLNNTIVKIPNVRELLVLSDDKVYQNKYLNSDIGNNFIRRYKKGKVNIKKNKVVKFDKVLLFCSRWDHNWRHFLTETFFNLKDAFQNPKVTIIICKGSPKHIYELFTILNINNYYEIDDKTMIQANEIIIPSNNKELKEVFLKNVIGQSTKLSKINNIKKVDKIYLTRDNSNKNYRYVSNQEDLDIRLQERNYYFLRGGSVPLYHQIYLINQANEIITQIGANCDNIIFFNEKCKYRFKIIYPFNCKKWARMYQDYKQCKLLYCGNWYSDNGQPDKYNWNYTIDFNKFKI